MNTMFIITSSLLLIQQNFVRGIELPLIVSLWENSDYIEAARRELVDNKGTALTAVLEGVEWCELNRCNQVGYGWSSDENGESSLDASIFDGSSLRSGSVGSIKLIRQAIRAAYYVLQYTYHSILVGREATDFAVQMGLERLSVSSPESVRDYEEWRETNCEVNYWRDVVPDSSTSCGPYWRDPRGPPKPERNDFIFNPQTAQPPCKTPPRFFSSLRPGRDSAGVIVIDKDGNVAAGTSTAGRNHRIPGRISDCAVPGAACYASNDIGAAITTGNGDIMARLGSSVVAMTYLELGFSARDAALKVIDRVNKWYPNIQSGIVVVGIDGDIGAACAGFKNLSYSVISGSCSNNVRVETVPCSVYPIPNC